MLALLNHSAEAQVEAEEVTEVESHEFSCPACGGNMAFNPKEQQLVCEYCQNSIEIPDENTLIKEYSFKDAEELASHNWGDHKRVIHCSNCGGSTVVDASMTADFCIFCGSSQIIESEDQEGIRPESLIPFQVTDQEAKANFRLWIKKRFFAPKEIKHNQFVEKLKGIYIPFFTYDADTKTFYRAQRGTYYYTTRTKEVNGKKVTERVRHTRWQNVKGNFNEFYDDIPVNVSKKIDDKLVKDLGGFDWNDLKSYKPQYIAGFFAERYQISLAEGWKKAKGVVDDNIEAGIRHKVGGDEFRLINRQTDYGEVKFKHILLPLWISSFKFKKKVYQFIVNGQSGKVSGEYPKSWGKIALVVAGVALVGALIYFLSTQQQSIIL